MDNARLIVIKLGLGKKFKQNKVYDIVENRSNYCKNNGGFQYE